MNYFIDTEFNERPGSIELISLGITSDSGASAYWESSEFNEDLCNDWVRENVLPHLRPVKERLTLSQIRDSVIKLTEHDQNPVFWAYYGGYDWVVFCWLFGTMMDLPENFPKLCLDLQQWWIQLGKPDIKQHDPEFEHHALVDAQWNRELYARLLKEHFKMYGEIPKWR